MKQKIIKVGNSLAVTLPCGFVHDVGYKAGDEVIVEQNTTYKMLLVKPKTASFQTHLTPEFFSWLEQIGKRYERAIKELANK